MEEEFKCSIQSLRARWVEENMTFCQLLEAIKIIIRHPHPSIKIRYFTVLEDIEVQENMVSLTEPTVHLILVLKV